MGGTDVNASASTSSSATSGGRQDFKYGDIIVGRGASKSEGLPTWALVAIGGGLVVLAAIFLVRR